MADFKNDFSWSASRDRLFRNCKRAYFYNYYAYWNGWNKKSDAQTQLIYLLKKLQTTPLWAGGIVHDIIKQFLEIKQKMRPNSSEPELNEIYYWVKHWEKIHESETALYCGVQKTKAKREQAALQDLSEKIKNKEELFLNEDLLHAVARIKLRIGFRESLEQKKGFNSKKTYLFEHFYNEKVSAEDAGKISEKIYSALTSFVQSPAVQDILEIPTENWKTIDKLDKYEIDKLLHFPEDTKKYFQLNIPIWYAIDFAYIDCNSELWIIDWKTGKENTEELQNQLASYAIFANQEWHFAFDKIHLCGVYLNENGRFKEYKISESEIDLARKNIAESCRKMLDLLDNQEVNIASEINFPKTETGLCMFCNFKKICIGK